MNIIHRWNLYYYYYYYTDGTHLYNLTDRHLPTCCNSGAVYASLHPMACEVSELDGLSNNITTR